MDASTMLPFEKLNPCFCKCALIFEKMTWPNSYTYQCHCSLCRKQGGSSSNTGLIIEAKNFRWLKGVDKISSFVKDSGFRSDFCSKCGSVVPNVFRDKAYVWVPAGALDDDKPLAIAIQSVWIQKLHGILLLLALSSWMACLRHCQNLSTYCTMSKGDKRSMLGSIFLQSSCVSA